MLKPLEKQEVLKDIDSIDKDNSVSDDKLHKLVRLYYRRAREEVPRLLSGKQQDIAEIIREEVAMLEELPMTDVENEK